jgi:large subunit ribosomal protein L6
VSRIGKNPVTIPDGVTVDHKGQTLHVKGPKGELTVVIHPDIKITVVDKTVTVERPSDSNLHKSLHGLSRTLIANAIHGVKEGYRKELEIAGVGFKATVQGNTLVLNIGYSHPVNFPAPKGITISLDKENKNMIIVEGVDKQLVGETAAKIRALKKPEPYKGKGIHYMGEKIRRKAGKSAAK